MSSVNLLRCCIPSKKQWRKLPTNAMFLSRGRNRNIRIVFMTGRALDGTNFTGGMCYMLTLGKSFKVSVTVKMNKVKAVAAKIKI